MPLQQITTGFLMLYADIQIATTTAAIAAFATATALSAITVAATLVAVVGFGARINRARRLRINSLSLNLRQRSHDSILWQGAGNYLNRNGRNLHGKLRVIPKIIHKMLHLQNKNFINQLVGYMRFNSVFKNITKSVSYSQVEGKTLCSGMQTP